MDVVFYQVARIEVYTPFLRRGWKWRNFFFRLLAGFFFLRSFFLSPASLSNCASVCASEPASTSMPSVSATATGAETVPIICFKPSTDLPPALRLDGLAEVVLDLGLLHRLVRHADALTQLRAELSLDLGAQTLRHRRVNSSKRSMTRTSPETLALAQSWWPIITSSQMIGPKEV